MNIGQRLKYARQCRKMTQIQLAERIGVSRGVITNIELNKVETPQPIVTAALCNILEIAPDWLIYGEGEMDAQMSKAAEDPDMTKELWNAINRMSTEEKILLLQIMRLKNRE